VARRNKDIERIILACGRNWPRESLVPIEDDPRIDVFRRTFSTPPYSVDCCDLEDIKVCPDKPAIVLACVSRSDLADPATLHRVHDNGGRILIYADLATETADSALHWCDPRRGMAVDFVVRQERADVNTLARHALNVRRGEPVYPRIEVERWDPSKPIFVAATGEDTVWEPVMGGVIPALRKRGLPYQWFESVVTTRPFPEKLKAQIQRSTLLIAVIPKDAKPASIQNVHWEAGMASLRGIEVLFALEWPQTAENLPSDCRQLGCIVYENPTDLALQLYFGLTA
jgi:hypothetical protein